jgi:hypothetical protein
VDIIEVGWGSNMDRINLAQDRDQWRALVNTMMNLQVQSNVGKFLSIWATDSFSSRNHVSVVSCTVRLNYRKTFPNVLLQ